MADYPFVGNIGSIPADLGQSMGRGSREPKGRKPPRQNQPSAGEGIDEYLPAPQEEPAAALIETLDRLRATQELSPSEETTRRHLAGQRYYHRTPPTAEVVDALLKKHEAPPPE